MGVYISTRIQYCRPSRRFYKVANTVPIATIFQVRNPIAREHADVNNLIDATAIITTCSGIKDILPGTMGNIENNEKKKSPYNFRSLMKLVEEVLGVVVQMQCLRSYVT